VAFQRRVPDCGWGRITGADGWQDGTDAAWSEPIFAGGGKGLGKGGAPCTDARKSAVTDGLTRAAWTIGGGHEVFKGLVRTGNRQKGSNDGRRKQNTGATATAFWTLYHDHAKPRGISSDKAKELAGNGDWTEACNKLKALIAEA